MLDSLYIGMSGLEGFSQGLKVVSNNITNLNTTGFKGSTLQFGDMYYQMSPTGGQRFAQFGTGLATLGTAVDFRAGELRQTSNPLDASIDGEGFFVTRNEEGQMRLSKAGQFQFDANGFLVSKLTGDRVAGLGADGNLVDLSLDGLRVNTPVATGSVELQGNLSSTVTDYTLDALRVTDALGGSHVLKLTFKNASATKAGQWEVTLADDTGEVGKGTVEFADGRPVAGKDVVSFTYTPPGGAAQPLSIKLGGDMTSFASGNSSTVTMAKQDGVAAGQMTTATFDAAGKLSLSYSNGKTATGAQLAIALPRTLQALNPAGQGEFSVQDEADVVIGRGGEAGRGTVSAGKLEGSNVDLAGEFSNLIVMQRGYQASSRVISTANDMIQELFDMKGHR